MVALNVLVWWLQGYKTVSNNELINRKELSDCTMEAMFTRDKQMLDEIERLKEALEAAQKTTQSYRELVCGVIKTLAENLPVKREV